MQADLLFELGTEELPSGSVFPLAKSLQENLLAGLKEAGLGHGAARFFATPRRLAVLIEQVAVEQPSQFIAKRGPSVAAAMDAAGKPTPALIGFAKSCGVPIDALQTQETEKGAWWVYEAMVPGKATECLLPGLIATAIAALPIPKPMRWGAGDAQFARPVHWVVLLFGEKLVEGNILGIPTGRMSFGHRFHHPEALEILQPSRYESQLKGADVIADFACRKKMIIEGVQELAKTKGFIPIMPDDLVDEVTAIVEWPVPLLANFDEDFLVVPPEALIAAMQSHQKCFALQDAQGQLVPHFITVANIRSQNPAQVIQGNEKVMRARLSDAAFFFHQDKRFALEAYSAHTKRVIFQQALGTLYDKTLRIQAIMRNLAPALHLDESQVDRAALLSKCDLMTGMVGEFPELQGIVGYYYALHAGESEAVALALKEQYYPRFAGDILPQSILGTVLSLADRFDTLVGTFAIGQKPTGVKDPFKLRRHALAIVRILSEMETPLSLEALLAVALAAYHDTVKPGPNTLTEVKAFILERLTAFYQAQQVTADCVQAVLAKQDDCLFDFKQRVQALQRFMISSTASSLSSAGKRVRNLLNHVGKVESLTIQPELLKTPEEKALLQAIQLLEGTIAPLYVQRKYGNILEALATLKAPIDAFFDKVMVLVDDEALKRNRLGLLKRLQEILQGVADISLLQEIE